VAADAVLPGRWTKPVVDTIVLPAHAQATPAGTTQTFSSSAAITIPASGTGPGPSSPFPSTILVSGMPGTITDVNVTISGLSQTFPGDLDILLVGPGGESVILLSDVGGGTDISGVSLTFDQSASGSVPGIIVSGTYQPTNSGTGDTFPAPAPAGPYGASLDVFDGTSPNGTWSLYIQDDAGADVGSATGWSLEITSA
jgi:subtilisin-like proprotein convertase family protein